MKTHVLVIVTVGFWFIGKVLVLILPTGESGAMQWLLPASVSLSAILISMFLLAAGSSLAAYNVDILTFAGFLIFETILRFDIVANSGPAAALRVLAWIMAAITLVAAMRHRLSPGENRRSLFILIPVAIAAGITLALLGAYVITHTTEVTAVSASSFLWIDYIPRALAYEASNAAVPEEFVFRGMLWGYLVSRVGSERKAWLLQGVLFWLAHFDRVLAAPLVFWIVIPTLTAVLSFLVWRARSLVPAVIAHTLYNTLVGVFGVMMMSHL